MACMVGFLSIDFVKNEIFEECKVKKFGKNYGPNVKLFY